MSDREIKLQEAGLSPGLPELVAREVLKLVKISLTATVVLTVLLSFIDAIFIFYKIIGPADRLVSEKVLMTIVGATIVQVGAALYAIVYSLFNQKPQIVGDT